MAAIALMIYASRPWGDNYAYEHWTGYIMLVGFLAWAVSPYAALAALLKRSSNPETA